MKVLFLTIYDRNGPSSRVRVYQFLEGFSKRGINPEVRPLLTGEVNLVISQFLTTDSMILRVKICVWIIWAFILRIRDILSAWKYDAVVVQKDVLPFGLYWLLRLVNRNILFEFDDAIWLKTKGNNKSPLILPLIFWYRRRLFRRIVSGAKVVLAENEYLAKECWHYAKRVEVISAPIDTDKYVPAKVIKRQKNSPLVIGWLGSPSTSYLLKSLEPVLNEIGRRNQHVEVHNIGGEPLSFADIQVKNITWEESTEVQNVNCFDIGLMPLDDSDFNKGRLGYKMIVYQSLALPVVAQNRGLNSSIVKDGVNGFLVDCEEDWLKALEQLILNSGIRAQMGKMGRKNTLCKFDLNLCCDRFADLIRSVAETWQVKLARLHPGKRVRLKMIMDYFSKKHPYLQCLDVGTGTGALARIYSSAGKHWDYVDPDPAVRKEAVGLLGEVSLFADLDELKGKTYDLITVVDTFFYFSEPDKIARILADKLNRGGELVVTLSEGAPKRFINRLRESLGIGKEARGFVFEESSEMFCQRMLKCGFKLKYETTCSTFLLELVLLLMDFGLCAQRKSAELTSAKEVRRLEILTLKCLSFLFAPLYCLDKMMNYFVRGYKILFVFHKS